MTVIPPGAHHSLRSRPAQTRYKTVTGYDDFTLVACDLHTGRTHQIWADDAASLTLKRPSDNQEMTFAAALPPELQAILNQLDDPQ